MELSELGLVFNLQSIKLSSSERWLGLFEVGGGWLYPHFTRHLISWSNNLIELPALSTLYAGVSQLRVAGRARGRAANSSTGGLENPLLFPFIYTRPYTPPKSINLLQ